MNTSKRKNHIQIRMSDSEIQKFKQLSKSLGLTLSGFARYSMTKLQKAMGHSSIKVSLTYLRGLEAPKLSEEDMPMLNLFSRF